MTCSVWEWTNHLDSFNASGMKNVLIFFFVFGFTHLGFTQNEQLLERANKLFAKKAYVEAAAMYEKLGTGRTVLQNLGDSYYFNSKMGAAAKAYKKLFEKYQDSIPKEIYFRYAQTLMGLNNYPEADKLMTDYRGSSVNTERFKKEVEEKSEYIHEIKQLKKSQSSDFGISYFGDKVVFASTRNASSPNYEWNNQPYLDLFEATVDKDGELKNIRPFSEKINTRTHESNATFSKDGKTMYFSRTNNKRVKIGDEKVATVKIFKAELKDSTWTNVKELPFSSDIYSTQHPSLSSDGNRLFFSSDMPGGLGNFDIYYVDITNGTFGTPVNMGPRVNTNQRDQFPFITSDTLYFASDGHQGLGGLDVFMTIMNDNQNETVNVGEPINSGLDDFGYIIDKTDHGYFSSNRTGTDNLYSFIRRPKYNNLVKGQVVDKTTKEIVKDATVILFNDKDEKIAEMQVDENGNFEFKTKPNSSYKLEALKDLYIPTTEEFTTDVNGIIEKELEIELLSYDDAEEIVVERDGFNYIELENLYFDFNKWDILPQAGKTLNILIDLMNKYPRMEVQLGAHTDSRGSDSYNMFLSQNRAKSAMEYLIANGISRDRLQSIGFGETQPLVDCGANCSELEHSINRRVEFLILR